MCGRSNSRTVGSLIRAGADVNARDTRDRTPLLWAARWNLSTDIIAALITVGADVDVKDSFGLTPLMRAARWNYDPDIIVTLIEAGADIDAKTKDGRTALDIARNEDNFFAVTALVAAGAK